MTYIDNLDAQFQTIKGGFGSQWGQAFDVYRVTGSTNDAIVSGTPIISAFTAALERTTSKDDLQNAIFDLLGYEVVGDNTNLQLGDVLLQRATSKRATEMYTLAYLRLVEKTIAIRTDYSVTLQRPGADVGMAGEGQPDTGAIPVLSTSYGGRYAAADEFLTLKSGVFALSSDQTQTPARVPFGVQPLNRVRDGQVPNLPMEAYRDHFVAYLPAMGSIALRTLDTLTTTEGDVYRAILPYSSGAAGIVGNIMICEKLPSSST